MAEIRVLSVGNGYFPVSISPGRYNKLPPAGILLKYIRDFWFNPQSSAADDFAETLLTKEHMVTVNPCLF